MIRRLDKRSYERFHCIRCLKLSLSFVVAVALEFCSYCEAEELIKANANICVASSYVSYDCCSGVFVPIVKRKN